jgi:MtN3 and saliva related transmembrane protein
MTEKIIAGYVATFLSISGTIPQIIHTYKTKKTNDLSLFMILLVMSQCIAWVSYAILDNYNMPLLVCDTICFLQYFYLFMAKIYYDKLFCFKKSTIENTQNLEV